MGPVPYLELFWAGPVKKITLYIRLLKSFQFMNYDANGLVGHYSLSPFPDGCGRSKQLFQMPGMHLSSAPSWSSLSAVALRHRARGAQLPLLSCNSNSGASRKLLMSCWLLPSWWGVLCKLPLLWCIWLARGRDEASLGKQAWTDLQAGLEGLLQPTLQVGAQLCRLESLLFWKYTNSSSLIPSLVFQTWLWKS